MFWMFPFAHVSILLFAYFLFFYLRNFNFSICVCFDAAISFLLILYFVQNVLFNFAFFNLVGTILKKVNQGGFMTQF